MWRKSAYFVWSRSDAEPVGSPNQHITASWLLPFWLWMLHLLTFSVYLQAKFNPRSTAVQLNISSEYWEVSLIVLHAVCCTEAAVFLCIVIFLAHLSLYVWLVRLLKLTYLYWVNMRNVACVFLFKSMQPSLRGCIIVWLSASWTILSTGQVIMRSLGLNAGCLYNNRCDWTRSVSPLSPLADRAVTQREGGWLTGSCEGQERGELLWGKGRQSPGLTLDPTARCSPNKIVWWLKHPKCQQLYCTGDVMMMMMRHYSSATDATLQRHAG